MWFSENIWYGEELGYVMLQLPALTLPPFTFEDIPYEPKEELHCSLLCTRKLAETFPHPGQAEAAIIEFVRQYCRRHAFEFAGFMPKAYACREDEVRSIVMGAKVHGADELFAALRAEFPELAELSPPALHITLYKYNHRFGIGIQNEKQLQELCRVIPVETLPSMIGEMV